MNCMFDDYHVRGRWVRSASNTTEVLERDQVARILHGVRGDTVRLRDGWLSYQDQSGASRALDLRQEEIAEQGDEIPGLQLARDRETFIIATSNAMKLVSDGETKDEWPRPKGSDQGWAGVSLFGTAASEQDVKGSLGNFGRFILAEDGLHWAWHYPHSLSIGCGERVLCQVRWARRQAMNQKLGTFDLERSRFVVANWQGIAAIDFSGRVAAEALLTGRNLVVASAFAFDDESAVSVVRADGMARVAKFDLATLEPRGHLEGLACLPLQSSYGLARTADLSLLYGDCDGNVVVLPSEKERLEFDDSFARIVGPRAPCALQEPSIVEGHPSVGRNGDLPLAALDASTPSERQCLAYYLLAYGTTSDRRFYRLSRFYPDAFAPLADDIIALPWGHLRLLRSANRQWFTRLSRGASDEAVDALAARIQAELPGLIYRHIETPIVAQLEMLAHVCTPNALRHIGEIGRASKTARGIFVDAMLQIDESGPAVPRYQFPARHLILKSDGAARLRVGLPSEDWSVDRRGNTCLRPLQHLATFDAEVFDADLFPRGGHDSLFLLRFLRGLR